MTKACFIAAQSRCSMHLTLYLALNVCFALEMKETILTDLREEHYLLSSHVTPQHCSASTPEVEEGGSEAEDHPWLH